MVCYKLIRVFGRTSIHWVVTIRPNNKNLAGSNGENCPFFRKVHKTTALSSVKIANHFFSCLRENKMTDGNRKMDQETQKDYFYNNSGLPIQSETVSKRDGKKSKEAIFIASIANELV